ncbi:unnamed protein product, partial [Aphanomyces euteiches]
IHRSLGVHLTFVRSVNLDAWTQEQVTQMQKWGNAKAKEYFEALVPKDYRIPTEHSPVRDKEIWIRHKYERKRFVAQEGEEPEASDAEEPAPARRATAKAAPPPPAADILNLGDFSTPAPPAAQTNAAFGNFAAPPARAQNFDAFAAPPAPAKDEWAAFGGSSQQMVQKQTILSNNHQAAKNNIMASFGAPMAPQNAFAGLQPNQGAPGWSNQ